MPLSAIFLLYHGNQFLWWKKMEYPERTNDLQINMTLYLTKVFKKDFTETEDILVHTPDYLEKLRPIVENADKR
jgi:hypothetical protein